MSRRDTRERIPEIAHRSVLETGSRPRPSRARIEKDKAILDRPFRRGRDLADDPLEGFLIGLSPLAEMLADIPNGHPGRLVATCCYQERPFDRGVQALNRAAVLHWRARFRETLEEIAALHPPREPVDLDDLADMVSTIVEGGIVTAKAVRDPQVLSRQVLPFRSYVRRLFRPGLSQAA